MLLATALLVSLSVLTSAGGGHASSFATRKEQEAYLTKYGYMGSSNPDPRFAAITDVDQMFPIAVKKFQWMTGIEETGIVDEATVKMMKTPRCGNSDQVGMSLVAKRRRRRRYAAEGTRWSKTTLTYRINNYPPDLPQNVTEEEIQTAFQRWSDVSPLTFMAVTEGTIPVDIDMFFTDSDGKDNRLAYAYYPEDGGDVYFDKNEDWTSKNESGINLLEVAMHEIGHSLGLGHSDVAMSVLFPYYTDYVPDLQLHPDDIAGIQYIYGSMMQPTGFTMETPPPYTVDKEKMPSTYVICRDHNVDAIFAVDEDVYFFKGSEYHMGRRLRFLSPARPISADWPGLPDSIDTAVYLDGSIVFFKGQQFWRYNSSRHPDGKNPQNISAVFSGLPSKIDAAFVWSGNGKLYFISGDSYYRMSKRFDSNYQVDSVYPQPLKMWKGLPSKINAAFNYTNGRTYFFSGANYYRFNDVCFKVDPGYPKSTTDNWLGCSDRYVSQSLKSPKADMMEKEWKAGGDQFGCDGIQTCSGLLTTVIAVLSLCLLFP